MNGLINPFLMLSAFFYRSIKRAPFGVSGTWCYPRSLFRLQNRQNVTLLGVWLTLGRDA